MVGIECSGADLTTRSNVTKSAECCKLCSAHSGCVAYTFDSKAKTCALKYWCNYLVKGSKHKISSMLEHFSTPHPTCAVPSLGIGFRCDGETIATLEKPSGGCCHACEKHADCLVYSYNKHNNTCYLKHFCSPKPHDTDFITGWVPPPTQESAAKYQVGRGYYELQGYKCGQSAGTDSGTAIFYPKDTTGTKRFNVVVYGHGAWGRIDGSDDWLATVASLGLIVLAPFQGKDEVPCHGNFSDDLLTALQGSRTGGAALHPALAMADWSRVGLFGHSKGAKYVAMAASEAVARGWDVRAAVVSGDIPYHQPTAAVPTMFTTGTLDKGNSNNTMQPFFEQLNTTHKVYVNLAGAYHMEVQEGRRLNVLTSQFLACHVAASRTDCAIIYGTGSQSICNVNEYKSCVVIGSEPSNIVV